MCGWISKLKTPLIILVIVRGILWVFEQYLGSAVVDFIKLRIPLLSDTFSLALDWIKRNPSEVPSILFFSVATIIILHAYFSTLPPRGLKVNILDPLIGIYGNSLGIRITNHTGKDLNNCWIDIIRWDGKEEIKEQRTKWKFPERSHLVFPQPIEIPNGKSGDSYFIRNKLKTNEISFEVDNWLDCKDENEIELLFHANTNDGDTITLPFWIVIKNEAQNNIDHIIIKSIAL